MSLLSSLELLLLPLFYEMDCQIYTQPGRGKDEIEFQRVQFSLRKEKRIFPLICWRKCMDHRSERNKFGLSTYQQRSWSSCSHPKFGQHFLLGAFSIGRVQFMVNPLVKRNLEKFSKIDEVRERMIKYFRIVLYLVRCDATEDHSSIRRAICFLHI